MLIFQPCVVFCGHPTLRFGDVVHFIELWGNNPKNCIIFTGKLKGKHCNVSFFNISLFCRAWFWLYRCSGTIPAFADEGCTLRHRHLFKFHPSKQTYQGIKASNVGCPRMLYTAPSVGAKPHRISNWE